MEETDADSMTHFRRTGRRLSRGPGKEHSMIKETLPAHMTPLSEVNGFPVRPGLYEYFGAWAIPGGVSFTVHSKGATACEILLYHREEKDPYAVLPSRTATGSATSSP